MRQNSQIIDIESARFLRRLEAIGASTVEKMLAIQLFQDEETDFEALTTEELWIRDRLWELWESYSRDEGIAL